MFAKFSSPDVHGCSLLLSFFSYVATFDKATKIATIGLLSHIRTKNAQKFSGATIIAKLPREISVKSDRCFALYFAIIRLFMVCLTSLIASVIVKLSPLKSA